LLGKNLRVAFFLLFFVNEEILSFSFAVIFLRRASGNSSTLSCQLN